MAFSARVWTTDTAASLDDTNFDALSQVTSNQTDYIINNMAVTVPSTNTTDSNLMRVDSGDLTFANPECVIGTQNVATLGATSDEQEENNVGIFVNGGTLNIAGSASENDPHLFLKINGPVYNVHANGAFQTSQAGIALTEGTLNIGTGATPFCKIVSSKGLTVDPDGGEIQTNFLNTGNCTLNVQTLLIQNPHQDGVVDGLLPNLGFRSSSTGYVVGSSSFDTAILDGCNILDVSGAAATNAGMIPTNVVFRRGSFVGDNGGVGDGRANNALGFAYVGADGNTAEQEFIINTTSTVTGLTNTNWFVIGNSDVEIRASERFDGRRAGLVANRLITIEGSSGGTQSYYIPETNNRLTNGDVNIDNVQGQNDLGGFAFTPTGVTAPANSIPIGGVNGRFSVTGTTSATPIRVRMVNRYQIGSGDTIESATIHQGNEYVYFGNVDSVLGVQMLPLYQGGVQDLSVSIPDATDPIIDVLKSNSIATTAIAGATVTLPGLTDGDSSTTTVSLTEATDTNITMGQILATIKAALVTRVGTGVNTTVQATAEQYVNNWLDKIVNGTSPLTITNTGAGDVTLQSDAAYNNGLNTSIGSDVGGLVAVGTNVVKQPLPPNVASFTHDTDVAGGQFAVFSRTGSSAAWVLIGQHTYDAADSGTPTVPKTPAVSTVITPTGQYLSLWKPANSTTYTRISYNDLTSGITQDMIYTAPTLNIAAEVLASANVAANIMSWGVSVDYPGQIVGTVQGTSTDGSHATTPRLTNVQSQVAMLEALSQKIYFDLIVANVNTVSFIDLTEDRADYITAASATSTNADGTFIELISSDGSQQGMTAVDQVSLTALSGDLSAQIMGTDTSSPPVMISFAAVDIAANPLGISAPEVRSALRGNQQVILTAVQRGALKAATYSAGSLEG